MDDKKSPQDRNSPARRRALHPQGLRGWQRGTRADCEATQEKTLSAPPVLAVGFKQAQEEGFLRQFAHMKTHTNPLQLSSVARILSHTALHLEILDFGLHRVHSQLISDRLCQVCSQRALRSFVHQMPPLLMLTCTFARSRRQSARRNVPRTPALFGLATELSP